MLRKFVFVLLLIVSALAAVAQSPVISSFSPLGGTAGTVITINGTNLNNATNVSVGGQRAIIISASATKLSAFIMPNSATGAVAVTNPQGTANAAGNFTINATSYPNVALGGKQLPVGGGTAYAFFGCSIALSADGTAAVVGGYNDDNQKGGLWVFTRSGSSWVQQGPELYTVDYPNQRYLGSSVAMSADGNTLAASSTGGTVVYMRTNGVWTQQGGKLGGYGGSAVAMSADGNTLMMDGAGDANSTGVVSVYTRSNGVWTQQGSKLTPTGSTTSSMAGSVIAMSADGNTAVVGGSADNSNTGAIWVFTNNGGVWAQQGDKIIPSDAVRTPYFGTSVSISADGNTVAAGGSGDNYFGAAWVFTRTGNAWSQQGSKLVRTNPVNSEQQGEFLTLSTDGNTLIVTGNADVNTGNAAWVFNRTGNVWNQVPDRLALSNLKNGTFTKVAISADGSTTLMGAYGDDNLRGGFWTFTNKAYPITVTQPATIVTTTTASINGTINDNGSNTAVSMEYGTSADLTGSATAALTTGTSPVSAGAGTINFSAAVTGLQPGTLYHYRINGTNTTGVNHGATLSFTTLTPPVITSFAPAALGSGSIIIITGTNLLGTAAVTIGGVPAASFTVVSATTIYAVTGAAAGTTNDVKVTNVYGTGTLAGFSYINPPAISYSGDQSYTISTPVTPLLPTNNGGAIPANTITP